MTLLSFVSCNVNPRLSRGTTSVYLDEEAVIEDYLLSSSDSSSSDLSLSAASSSAASSRASSMESSSGHVEVSWSRVVRKTHNVYSPSLIVQGNTLVMYYGGWDSNPQTHDKIYRTACSSAMACESAGAVMLDSEALGFEHLNDPAVVAMPGGYYLMYMTGVRAGDNGFVLSNNHIYWALSSNGINWTKPALIASDLWLPSATIDKNGNVLLYGNSTANGSLVQLNLGASGVHIQSRTTVSVPRAYANVDVTYRASLGIFQIFAEVNSAPSVPNQIDYLTSTDGINWIIAQEGIVHPSAGNLHVRTPATHPQTTGIIFYGETASLDSGDNYIVSAEWKITRVQAASVKYKLTSVSSSEQISGLPAKSAIDGNFASIYSSNVFSSSVPNRHVYLAAWLDIHKGAQKVSKIILSARMMGKASTCFPNKYDLYLTTADNRSWFKVGSFSSQPSAGGQVVIPLSQSYMTYGVLMVPTSLGYDLHLNHYCQIAEIQLAN